MQVFLSCGVTRACLNAVGKIPVRRDVLIMCVSAGKSVGEIAWIYYLCKRWSHYKQYKTIMLRNRKY